jgi:hypothetical protein
MARLPKGEETSIFMTFVVMCAEKIMRLFCLYCRHLCVGLCLSTSWLALGGAQEYLPA